MYNHLKNILYSLPEPYIFMAGHTMGAKDTASNTFLPLIPPYTNSPSLGQAASLLGIGDMPITSWKMAVQLVAEMPTSRLAVLLNDTTHISSIHSSSHQVNQKRTELVESFAAEKGLPDIYLDYLYKKEIDLERILSPINNQGKFFWQESQLRSRFKKTINYAGNKSFFADKVKIEQNTDSGELHYEFQGVGKLNYCQLSSNPDSITGGGACVAELIQMCMELFGVRDAVLSQRHERVKKAKNIFGGTFVLFVPAVCRKPVIAGLSFYHRYLSQQLFEYIAIFCKPNFQSQIKSQDLDYVCSSISPQMHNIKAP